MTRYLDGNNYSTKFHDAIKFTESKQFNLDSNTTCTLDNDSLKKLVEEISSLIPNEIHKFNYGNGEIVNFGGGCGTVHPAIVCYIKQWHPNVMVNLTMGSVQTDDEVSIDFNQEKFCCWISGNKPETLDCHVWITINDNIIIDTTIGTYLNTRASKNNLKPFQQHAYGGVIYGHPKNLKYHSIANVTTNKQPDNFTKLKYIPVVIGETAFLEAAPKN